MAKQLSVSVTHEIGAPAQEVYAILADYRTHHPHIHMIVPGGGLSSDGTRWVACKPGFFLHVRVLSRLFRQRDDGFAAAEAKGIEVAQARARQVVARGVEFAQSFPSRCAGAVLEGAFKVIE